MRRCATVKRFVADRRVLRKASRLCARPFCSSLVLVQEAIRCSPSSPPLTSTCSISCSACSTSSSSVVFIRSNALASHVVSGDFVSWFSMVCLLAPECFVSEYEITLLCRMKASEVRQSSDRDSCFVRVLSDQWGMGLYRTHRGSRPLRKITCQEGLVRASRGMQRSRHGRLWTLDAPLPEPDPPPHETSPKDCQRQTVRQPPGRVPR